MRDFRRQPRPAVGNMYVSTMVTTMKNQSEKAVTFKQLHVPGKPIVLFNAWDAGSARVVADAGALAIATGSWSVAAAHGYIDGEALPLALAIENLARIVRSVELPVTIDFEAGYGFTPEAVAEAVARALDAGAIGFNIEDQIIGGTGLYEIADQCRRLTAARKAADHAKIPAFINARTDLFLKAAPEHHSAQLVGEALHRAQAYAAAGASGFFVPGLIDEKLIADVCTASPLPVNIMMKATAPSAARLAELGVARISHGPNPYRQAMAFLREAANAALRSAAA